MHVKITSSFLATAEHCGKSLFGVPPTDESSSDMLNPVDPLVELLETISRIRFTTFLGHNMLKIHSAVGVQTLSATLVGSMVFGNVIGLCMRGREMREHEDQTASTC